MKTTLSNFLAVVIVSAFLYNCASSYDVVHESDIYKVKGNNIYKNGNDVTESLTEETKTSIQETLDARLALRAEEEKKQEELEKRLKEQEKIQKQAEKRQAELENKQEEIKKRQEEREDARKAFINAKQTLKKEQKNYNRHLEKGKLSPEDIKQWDNKIEKLEKAKDEALEYYQSFFN